MFTTAEAHQTLNALLDNLRDSLRPDQPCIAHIEALRLVEETATRAVRRELISPVVGQAYKVKADRIMQETEAELLERASRRASSPPPTSLGYADTWSTPEAQAAVAGETGWSATRYDDDLDVLVFDNESLQAALDCYSTAELIRLISIADLVLWQREAAAVALARRADPRDPSAHNLIHFPLHAAQH